MPHFFFCSVFGKRFHISLIVLLNVAKQRALTPCIFFYRGILGVACEHAVLKQSVRGVIEIES